MFFAISIQVVRWVGCGKPSHLLAFGHLFCSIFLVFDKNMFDSADGALEQVASFLGFNFLKATCMLEKNSVKFQTSKRNASNIYSQFYKVLKSREQTNTF